MSVSLIALRLEIAEGFPLLPHLNFSVSRAKRHMALSDPGLKKEPKDISKNPIAVGEVHKTSMEKYRGLREVNEISVETFQNEDVCSKKKTKVTERETINNRMDGSTKECAAVPLNESKSVCPEAEKLLTETYKNSLTQSEKNIGKSQKQSSFQPKEIPVKTMTSEEIAESYNLKTKDAIGENNLSNLDRRSRLLQTQIPFLSGNQFVEVTKGLLHLYKENQRTSMAEEAERSEMICILAVPAVLTTHDLLQFTAPVSGDIEHLRIIRESKPNQYMVLIKFRNQLTADEFYKNFNGMKFNTIEEEVCHLAFVARVETVKESEEACLPLAGHTELPMCPVCLERMDESVEGILTILCNHSFHGSCLAKWGDTSCPVCRYCQTPEPEPENRCFGCGSQDSLWICLICGHVGCGRYVDGHAYQHYLDTQHTYAMQLGNNRVWDYAGDNYVHRLVQNKADGKLVELEPSWAENEEKMDSMQLEYTYLLTSQLEAQRHYFEDKLTRFETDAHKQMEEMKEKTKHAVDERKQLEEKLSRVTKEKQSLDKKLSQITLKLNKISLELKDEKEMNRCLRQNQHLWQQKLTLTEKNLKELKDAKEKEIQSLQEQVRDVMFYLEAQNKLQDVPNVTPQEIQEGQIFIGEAAGTSTDATVKQRRKKHR